MSASIRFPCPCCGYLTYLDKPNGGFDICPVCRWEDDPVQIADPDYAGGANAVSLNEGRRNFAKYGAVTEAQRIYSRLPFFFEIPKEAG